MTVVVLVAIVALAAGGLVVGYLAIAHVWPFDDSTLPEVSVPPPRHQVTIQTRSVMPHVPADAPSPRTTPEPLTRIAQKPPRRSEWHGIGHAWRVWKAWRVRHADELRRRAGWVALVLFSAVLAYLVAHF